MKMPHYPHDRLNGYVLLSVGDRFYVPRFKRAETGLNHFQSFKKHWSAWRVLLGRAAENECAPDSLSWCDEHTI